MAKVIIIHQRIEDKAIMSAKLLQVDPCSTRPVQLKAMSIYIVSKGDNELNHKKQR